MFVKRLLYPVKALGPGNRIGIWVSGCVHKCKGCANPELWDLHSGCEISVEKLFELTKKIADKHRVDGFTITGGDPMLQREELAKFLKLIGQISPDILVYTGYLKEEIPPAFLHNIAVLIDGHYIEERNKCDVLRGSDNQKIIYLKPEFASRYEEYIEQNKVSPIQNFYENGRVISVGIHERDF